MNFLRLFIKRNPIAQPPPPTSSTSLSDEVIQAYKNDEYEAVIKGCNQLLETDPTNQEAYRIRGYAKYKLGDVDGASNDVRMANQLAKL